MIQLILRKLLLSAGAALAISLVLGIGVLVFDLFTMRRFGIAPTWDLAKTFLRDVAGSWPDIIFFTGLFWALASARLPLYAGIGVLVLLTSAAAAGATLGGIGFGATGLRGVEVFFMYLALHLFLRLNDWLERRQTGSHV